MFNIDIVYILAAFPAIIIALALHEFGHAAMATKMGDPTPKSQGRLTLNPIAHMDPMGTIFIIFTMLSGFGFGWGKPVITNPAYYKDYKAGRILVAVAGPMMNLCLMLLAIGIGVIVSNAGLLPYEIFRTPNGVVASTTFIHKFLSVFIMINFVLMVFNLLPVPPLDGGHVVEMVLPWEQRDKFRRFGQYGMLLLLGLMFFGVLTMIINFFFGILITLMTAGFGESFSTFFYAGLLPGK